jgi:outer membrane protein TolC
MALPPSFFVPIIMPIIDVFFSRGVRGISCKPGAQGARAVAAVGEVRIMLLAFTVATSLLTGCSTTKVLSPQEITDASRMRMGQLDSRKQALGDGISLAEAMTWAMDNNLSLRAESLERAVATQNRRLASVAMLPNLTAQAGYHSRSNLAGSSSANAVTGVQSLVPSTSSDMQGSTRSLEASWNVLDFSLAWLRARSEGDKEHAATESRRRMAHQLALDVVYVWDRALTFQRIEPSLHQIREQVQNALRQSDRVAASRLRDPVEVLEYRSALLLILKRMDALVLQMDQSRDELARLLGLPASSSMQLDETGALALAALPVADLKMWQYVALLNRPEVRESMYAKRNAERSGMRRLVEQFPSLLFSYGTNYDSNSFLVNNTWEDASVSLSLSLVRLATLPMQQKLSALERQQAELKADLQATAVLSQVAIALKSATSTRRQACLSTELSRTSDERLGLLEARYRAAALDELSVVRARVDSVLLNVERDMADIESRRATLMMAQSVGIGALPEQVFAYGGEDRIGEVAVWLQSGLVDETRAKLALAQQEFAPTSAEPATESISGPALGSDSKPIPKEGSVAIPSVITAGEKALCL